jgi:hypothetical protein
VPFYYGYDEQLQKMVEFLRSGNYLNLDIFALRIGEGAHDFGLDQAKKVDSARVQWLSGQVDVFRDLTPNRLYVLQEGGKILKSDALVPAKAKAVKS